MKLNNEDLYSNQYNVNNDKKNQLINTKYNYQEENFQVNKADNNNRNYSNKELYEYNNKNYEDEYHLNNNNSFKQSVKNRYGEEEDENYKVNNLNNSVRNSNNFHQTGAYEKFKEHTFMPESNEKENKDLFLYDSRKSRKNSNGKNKELRYLKGKLFHINYYKIFFK